MKEVTAEQVNKFISENADFMLIDVRESHEYQEVNMGGELIPLGEILDHQDKIPKDKMVVVHCRSGVRSAQAIMLLEQMGFDNLHNLRGGIVEYVNKFGI